MAALNMRYRKLTSTGDYQIGHGSGDFWVDDPNGVAQSVQTRLNLWEGEWFLNQTEGTPYSTQILGYATKPLYDMAIRARVLGTLGVTSIDEYSSELDAGSRQLTVSVKVNTQFSKTPIPVPPVVL